MRKSTFLSKLTASRVDAPCRSVLAVVFFSLVVTTGKSQEVPNGVYVTTPAATMYECGDRLSTGELCDGMPGVDGRRLPLSATLIFDSDDGTPFLDVVIHNAVWEGGAPFELAVQSSFFQQSGDAYHFFGDYHPPNSGYFFDWQFSTSTEGVRWNGAAYWSGGHIWQIAYEDVFVVPIPEPSGVPLLLAALAFAASLRRTSAGSIQQV